MSKERVASRRDFLLYWFGVFVVAFSFVGIMLTISGLITDILNTQCYFPYVSQMLGVQQGPSSMPANSTIVPQPGQGGSMIPYPPPYPYYCYGIPVVAVIQFTFKLLSSLIFMAVGGYMVLNGKKR